jgi:hypothetical protein
MSIEDDLLYGKCKGLDLFNLCDAARGTITEMRAELKSLYVKYHKAIDEIQSLREHCDRLEKQIDSAVVAQEDYARQCSRDAFLDGANWLEYRLRDKPLSAYYTRMAWEEACRRWGEEGRDGQGA